jgi:hypothetical protein
MLAVAWDRLWMSFVIWLAIMGILEIVRHQRINRLPWWAIHGPLVAWGALTLVPWFIALRTGFWLVAPKPSATIPLTLPATYGFNLLALVGLAAGVAPFAFAGRRGPAEQAVRARITVLPGKAFVVIVILLAAYIISLPSWANLWSLSSTPTEDLYSTNGSFLTLSLTALVVIAVGYMAEQRALSWVAIVLYLALLVLTVGSAHRYLVMILILSYLFLRRPKRQAGGTPIQWLVLLILGATVVWLVGFSGLGQLSILRSGRTASSPSVYTQKTLASLDVISSAEYVLESGVQPGQLHGASYLALPGELIPRLFLGSRSTPPALVPEQYLFGMKSGASAPLWMEGVLNLGAAGDLVSMIVFAGSWGLILRQAMSSRSRLGKTVASIGPIWILFAYQALSRILMGGVIHLFAGVILGLLLWSWMHADGGSPVGCGDAEGELAPAGLSLDRRVTSSNPVPGVASRSHLGGKGGGIGLWILT